MSEGIELRERIEYRIKIKGNRVCIRRKKQIRYSKSITIQWLNNI